MSNGDGFIQAHADIVVRALAIQEELDKVVRRLVDLSDDIPKREGVGKIKDVMTEAERVMDAIDKNVAALRALLPEFEKEAEADGD